MHIPLKTVKPLSALLLDWYDANARSLPWRIEPASSRAGKLPDPYTIWLSEIMAQQTQLATVERYYLKFLRRWPTIDKLARADLEEILSAWAGLGYYSRARNLKKCADEIHCNFDGIFPQSSHALQKLPGIGEYTAAAIAAISFGEPIAIVDGNVERVISRVHAIDIPLPKSKPVIRAITQEALCLARPGDFGQAMMDLGATICTPRNPQCGTCPLAQKCKANASNQQLHFPIKLKRKSVPARRGAGFVAFSAKNQVFLRKRPETGMLAGMSEVPTTDWNAKRDGAIGIKAAPFGSNWKYAGLVTHSFTHFKLELEVYNCDIEEIDLPQGWWAGIENLEQEALPTLMKKAIDLALNKRKL